MKHFKYKIRNKQFHRNYTHKTLYPGAVFSTRYDGDCKILGRSLDTSRRGYYVVEFKSSGITKEAYGSHIGTCQRNRTFMLWHNMLARCYTLKNGRRYFKGYNDVRVCNSWHNFQTFCSDLPAIPGYKRWLENPGDYELDKDYLHRRHYSPDTVCFISASDNARESRARSAAMKIPKQIYRKIMEEKDLILLDTLRFFRKNAVLFEVIRHGNVKVFVFSSPYGAVVYYPLTKKIQRECYVTEGNEVICLKYLNWLKQRWSERNPEPNAVEIS